MDIKPLQTFSMWCTIINAAVLVLWITMARWPRSGIPLADQMFCIPRETFNVFMYSFIGVYKIFFLIFNLVPYVALLIME